MRRFNDDDDYYEDEDPWNPDNDPDDPDYDPWGLDPGGGSVINPVVGGPPDPTPSPAPDLANDYGGVPDPALPVQTAKRPVGPLLTPFGGSFRAPTYGDRYRSLMQLLGPAPMYTAPELPTIAPFTREFKIPTAEDVYQDPSYGFRKGQGEQALLNNRAAQGLLRTGGTLKDFMDYNQNFASQEYGNVYNRRAGEHTMARDDWRGNADVTLRRGAMDQERARSMYEPRLFEWRTRGELGSRAEDVAFDQSRNAYLDEFDQYRKSQDDIFQRLKWLSEYGND